MTGNWTKSVGNYVLTFGIFKLIVDPNNTLYGYPVRLRVPESTWLNGDVLSTFIKLNHKPSEDELKQLAVDWVKSVLERALDELINEEIPLRAIRKGSANRLERYGDDAN